MEGTKNAHQLQTEQRRASNGNSKAGPRASQGDGKGEICASREMVTRLFGDFKKKQLLRIKGSTLILQDKTALDLLAND
jgi:CRP-like cAMP-binding protein